MRCPRSVGLTAIAYMDATRVGQQGNRTTSKIIEEIRNLDESSRLKLANLSRVWSVDLRVLEGKDLLQEAVGRLLDGRRNVPENVDLVYALAEIMRSIASHERQRQARQSVGVDLESTLDPEEADVVDQLIDEEALRNLEDRVGNDNAAAKVLQLQRLGYGREEICDELEISQMTYESATKRIRRAVLKEQTNE